MSLWNKGREDCEDKGERERDGWLRKEWSLKGNRGWRRDSRRGECWSQGRIWKKGSGKAEEKEVDEKVQSLS